MSLSADQVISTVLMRLGNRQGNAVLAAQALLEYDLLLQELYELPTLPKFLLSPTPFSRTYTANEPLLFSGYDTLDNFGYIMIRLAPAKNGPHPVLLHSLAGEVVERQLIPLSEDDWDVLHQDDADGSSGTPTHYTVSDVVVETSDVPAYCGHAPKVRVYPQRCEQECILYFQGYFNFDYMWLRGPQNLVIAGLGRRMAPYVRDNNMLQLFEVQYQRELQRLLDRDTAVEEEHKSGLRGDLEDR